MLCIIFRTEFRDIILQQNNNNIALMYNILYHIIENNKYLYGTYYLQI